MARNYPTESSIQTEFTQQGVEEPAENLYEHLEDMRRYQWDFLKRTECVAAIGVYMVPTSDTTYKVRAGYYRWGGEIILYAGSSAQDPTNNDTTYVWMTKAGTISSGIDGDGWPSADHIKLAAVVVDSSGNITDIVDRRTVILGPQDQEYLLSKTTIALDGDGDTTLYTVPTSYRCVLSYAILVAGGNAGATTTITIGQNGATTDFLASNILSNLDAQYDAVRLLPIPNTTPLKSKSYAAATVLKATIGAQSGSAVDSTLYLFGTLYPA